MHISGWITLASEHFWRVFAFFGTFFKTTKILQSYSGISVPISKLLQELCAITKTYNILDRWTGGYSEGVDAPSPNQGRGQGVKNRFLKIKKPRKNKKHKGFPLRYFQVFSGCFVEVTTLADHFRLRGSHHRHCPTITQLRQVLFADFKVTLGILCRFQSYSAYSVQIAKLLLRPKSKVFEAKCFTKALCRW